jgi:hypothetical protein
MAHIEHIIYLYPEGIHSAIAKPRVVYGAVYIAVKLQVANHEKHCSYLLNKNFISKSVSALYLDSGHTNTHTHRETWYHNAPAHAPSIIVRLMGYVLV